MNGVPLVDRLRALTAEERQEIYARCTARGLAALKYSAGPVPGMKDPWRDFWARPDVRKPDEPHLGWGQIAPAGEWDWWFLKGGRGGGKTFSCSKWVISEAERLGEGMILHCLGATPDDARATMIEGKSGLKALSPPWMGFEFRSSVEGGIFWWKNGARGRVFGADKPAKGRGPECNRFWVDDPAAFGPHGKDVLDQLLFGFRIRAPKDGSDPRGVVSSTPAFTEIMEWFQAGETAGARKVRIVYSFCFTDDNRANLAENYFNNILEEFAGTELEEQERYGRLPARGNKAFGDVKLTAAPVMVHRLPSDPPEDTTGDHIIAVGIWIDPSSSTTSRSCAVGVVGVALSRKGHVYGWADRSKVMSAAEWPGVAWDLMEEAEAAWPYAERHFGVEIITGGSMGPELLKAEEKIRRMRRGLPGFSVTEIRTAKPERESSKSPGRGSKTRRAAPAVRLAKDGFLHLLSALTELARQLRDLDDTNERVDGADAFIHGVLDLALGEYSVGGGAEAPPAVPAGPRPVDAVAVGPCQVSVQPFQVALPAGWR